MNDLISLIIPIYKVEDYLSRCIDSILRQTYVNLEVILVDDGSPDSCGQICDEYARKDARIRVIHKKNGGLSDARNAALDIAQGEYITFIDSDDWINIEYVKKLYELISNTNSDIAVCNFIRTSEEKLSYSDFKEEIHVFSNLEALEQLTGKFYEQLVIACGKLYKKGLFKTIRFPVGKLHEDEFITYKLIYKAKKIVLTTAQLLYYWQREDSIMGASSSLKSRFHAIEALKERAIFLEEIGLDALSKDTYKKTFAIYMYINKKTNEIEKVINTEKFQEELREFRVTLRGKKYSLKFKFFYEMYFFSPRIADICLKRYSAIKKRLKSDREEHGAT